jgi:hypothetical protein
MKIRMLISIIAMVFVLDAFTKRPSEAQSLPTVNIATAAAGQSGYIAALIDAKGLAAKHGIKINNLMMDFTRGRQCRPVGTRNR